ncbi:MAG: hypothetical protein K0R57_6130 [Paenibacillaceae bacterium]|jgi:heme-degrading monooxygenase HmoA|nr:hypothetical protein [Paenibacillaceae bacterium]
MEQVDQLENATENAYYAAIFSSQRTEGDHGYVHMLEKMVELASRQPGFLGIESVTDSSGAGITVSYWDSLEAINNWRNDQSHMRAKHQGAQTWYHNFQTRICRIEGSYSAAGQHS